MLFLLVVGNFIQLLFAVDVGITVILFRVGAIVGLRRRRLWRGFAELSYESRTASVLSVEWGLSLGDCVVTVRDV